MKTKHLILPVLLFVATSVFSQSISVGPQLGYVKTKDAEKGVFLPAVAARLHFIGLGVEASIGYKSEEFADGQIETTTYPILLTGMINLLPIIHAEAGIGWYNTKIDYSDDLNKLGVGDETVRDIGYHIGAGAEIPLGSAILTGDIRYVFLNVDFDDGFQLVNEKSDFYSISVGLLFKL